MRRRWSSSIQRFPHRLRTCVGLGSSSPRTKSSGNFGPCSTRTGANPSASRLDDLEIHAEGLSKFLRVNLKPHVKAARFWNDQDEAAKAGSPAEVDPVEPLLVKRVRDRVEQGKH